MNLARFWSLIEESRWEANDSQGQVNKLRELLAELDAQELVAFDNMMVARLADANRQDLLALTRIVNDSCSEDAFRDFRGWLITQGREFYQAVLNSPERVIERVIMGEYAGCGEILDIAATTYEEKMGENLPFTGFHVSEFRETIGMKWTDEDLPHLYPQLCRLYNL